MIEMDRVEPGILTILILGTGFRPERSDVTTIMINVVQVTSLIIVGLNYLLHSYINSLCLLHLSWKWK